MTGCSSKKLVNDPIICVAESQVDYINNLTRNVKLLLILTMLWASSRNVTGWQKHFGELFMLDDDVHACKPIYVEKKENLADKG